MNPPLLSAAKTWELGREGALNIAETEEAASVDASTNTGTTSLAAIPSASEHLPSDSSSQNISSSRLSASYTGAPNPKPSASSNPLKEYDTPTWAANGVVGLQDTVSRKIPHCKRNRTRI